MSKGVSVLLLRKDREFSEILLAAGFEVKELPLVSTEPVGDLRELFQVLERLDEYDGAIFTSRASATIFIEALKDRQKSMSGKPYVLGNRANEIFVDAGLETVFDPEVNTVDEMIDRLGTELYEKRLLFVRGENSLRTVSNRLKGLSVVHEVIVYRTVIETPGREEAKSVSQQLSSRDIDWLCFFSPSAVEAFYRLFGQAETTRVASIGPTTARRAEELGFKIGFVSPYSSSEKFAAAFVSHLNGNS